MKTRLLFVRLALAVIIFGTLFLFLIVTPILVAADSGPLGGVSTGTATSYAYLPVVLHTAVETGVATLSEHTDTFVAASIYGFLGFGLMLGVVGLFLPFASKQDMMDKLEAGDE
jgi:hypothetical protein